MEDVEPFQWVLLWEDLIPQHHLVALFEAEFFPKWLHALITWLSNGPDYEEVSRWYLGWKKMFSQELLANDRIRTQFNVALEVCPHYYFLAMFKIKVTCERHHSSSK